MIHQARTCEVCRASFLPKYSVTREYWATRRFCSPDCSQRSSRGSSSKNKGRTFATLEERFWSKVTKGRPNACWEWQGARQVQGYGYLHAGAASSRRWEIAHRVAWTIHFGEVPEGLVVCHHCDNPPCCNPAHLFLGTRADNNRDRRDKGRSHSKLNEVGVREIMRRLEAGERQASIAKLFNVTHQTISDISRHKAWAHLW